MIIDNPYHDGNGKITQMRLGDGANMLISNLEATQVLSQFLAQYRVGIRSQLLEQLAYQDGLPELFHDACKHMDNDLQRMYKMHVFPFEISVAFGYSILQAGNYNLKEVIHQADTNMYENKKKMKELNNNSGSK